MLKNLNALRSESEKNQEDAKIEETDENSFGTEEDIRRASTISTN